MRIPPLLCSTNHVMSQGGVLTFVIVGGRDQPIYEVDFTGPKEVCARREAQWIILTIF